MPPSLRRLFTRGLRKFGYQLVHLESLYEFDGLHTVHHARFRDHPKFQAAWEGAFEATGRVSPGSFWRIHVGLWAAALASRVPGDFVECGVNAGFLSSAIVRFLDWNGLRKRFYLVDTFSGPVLSQYSEEEVARGRRDQAESVIASGGYVTDLDVVRRRFRAWEGVELVGGTVPDVLPRVAATQVAFLHLDMNCAYPEREALRFFWDRMSPGGIVLLDDYAYFGCEAQGEAIDSLAGALGASVLALPTGQGMIVR